MNGTYVHKLFLTQNLSLSLHGWSALISDFLVCCFSGNGNVLWSPGRRQWRRSLHGEQGNASPFTYILVCLAMNKARFVSSSALWMESLLIFSFLVLNFHCLSSISFIFIVLYRSLFILIFCIEGTEVSYAVTFIFFYMAIWFAPPISAEGGTFM